ncbi:MAG: methyltransferase domain-containing protein [Candidatus Woesearchaeota archaeon]
MDEEKVLNEIEDLLRNGYSDDQIRKKISYVSNDLIEVAKARILAKSKNYSVPIWSDVEGMRYSTNEIVAKYRAERLKPSSVADISCGIGIQLIHFARYASIAIGVDIDPKKIEYAKRNAQNYGLNHIRFIVGDSLSEEIISKINVEVIFSDPARDAFARERKLEDLKPNPLMVYEKYHYKTEKFVFDLPPQIERKKIPWKGEFEYIELNNEINRLTFYSQALSLSERTAVILPKNIVIRDNPKLRNIVEETDKIKKFLYEIPISVVYADLINEFFHLFDKKLYLLKIDQKRTFSTSDYLISSDYFRETYEVKAVFSFSIDLINRYLKENNYGKAIIKFSIPSENYWSLRKRLESDLKGDRIAYITKFQDMAVVMERIRRF